MEWSFGGVDYCFLVIQKEHRLKMFQWSFLLVMSQWSSEDYFACCFCFNGASMEFFIYGCFNGVSMEFNLRLDVSLVGFDGYLLETVYGYLSKAFQVMVGLSKFGFSLFFLGVFRKFSCCIFAGD